MDNNAQNLETPAASTWPWQHAKVGTAPAEVDLTLQHAEGCDTALFLGPRKMLSWGPRHEQFNHEVAHPKNGENTHFWSVFTHGIDGELQVVADVEDEGQCTTMVRELIGSWLFFQYLGEGQTADLDPFPFGESIKTAREIYKAADKLVAEYWQAQLKRNALKAAEDL